MSKIAAVSIAASLLAVGLAMAAETVPIKAEQAIWCGAAMTLAAPDARPDVRLKWASAGEYLTAHGHGLLLEAGFSSSEAADAEQRIAGEALYQITQTPDAARWGSSTCWKFANYEATGRNF